MRHIPPVHVDVEENITTIGDYTIHATIGEGQYASVYACTKKSTNSNEHHTISNLHLMMTPLHSNELAVKVIDKTKVTDILALERIHSEISALKDPALRHASILSLKDVVHTSKYIYLVTERGGKDLFEYFGPHESMVLKSAYLYY